MARKRPIRAAMFEFVTVPAHLWIQLWAFLLGIDIEHGWSED